MKSKINFLNNLFNIEKVNHPSYMDGNDIDTITNDAILLISKLNYEKITLELTPFKSIIFTILINKSDKFYIDVYFNPESDKEAFFTYYKNKIKEDSDVGLLNDIIDKIKNILNR